MAASEKREMAKRSNRRRVSLLHPEAFEVDSPISSRRADAHHGQESQNSTNRSDIRSQSYLVARHSIRSCKPKDRVLISLPNNPARRGRPNSRRAELAELSTAARPPASERGALPGGRPWITPRPHADPAASRQPQGSPTAAPRQPPRPLRMAPMTVCLFARNCVSTPLHTRRSPYTDGVLAESGSLCAAIPGFRYAASRLRGWAGR